MAISYIKGAGARLETVKGAVNRGDLSYAVRQAQECVELCLKSALRFVGIEPPKWHDVGIILKKERNRFPEWFKKEMDRFAFISKRLRREREQSMYGDEDVGLTPDELYSEYDAKIALEDARFVYMKCSELIKSN